ncbi:GNAT superfamily N-acetyltransferase [Streptomyces africanus]|uniref:GNAT superfamily N-acetyltransferase n=1 Tax=Streptomyces africanus TaxID=231024 RepID=A0ABU0QMD3_9ACTN|nr:GNAT family N-acetyltransferase [Streptomyces africanus]MDQ0748546.1 GNAT superfamily N-acetyltransferase [Streptomyces africanus]
MKITVRAAVEEDLAALLGLYGELNPDDTPLTQAAADAVWAAISGQQGRTVLVAEADGVVAGTADCIVMPNLTRGGRAILFVENVVVAGRFQRRGLGRRLMESAVRLGKAAGCYKVQLLAADDAYVHHFYAACGFKAVAQGFRRYME